MKKWHVSFDVSIRKFDDEDNEIEPTEDEVRLFHEALNVEVRGLQEMDFDLDIDVADVKVLFCTQHDIEPDESGPPYGKD